jgi:predicted AlkP superfamily phosphohydrolase/phosphomutase/tetratricopeptide (TPR) repeat protein
VKRSDLLCRRALLIGWDGADWKVIHPLLDAGKMPNLERLVHEGVMGNLATLHPDLSPMLWTSIATGKRPFKHGIHGFTEPDPDAGGIRPVSSLSRKTKAVWNILSQEEKKSIVVGWWPSHPAEPINGVMVSNLYTGRYPRLGRPWAMPPGAVHPGRLVRNLAQLRWHPQKLNAAHILPFVPRAAEVEQDQDRRLETLSRIICDGATILSAATAVMTHEPWDFAAVYFDAIDHFSHAFMRYHPPRQPHIPEKDYDIYKEVVQSGYIFHDKMLGRLIEAAEKDCTILLVSDHGFQSDHLRPRHVPLEPAGPAAQHRPYGIFVMKGPGIKKDETVFGAGLLDVCPTILTLFGLPVGQDMDGRPLVNAFDRDIEISAIESWDLVPGEAGMHPPEKRMDPVEAQEGLNQLVALGYIEPPDADRTKAAAQTVRELEYNLARSYMDAGLYGRAFPILASLFADWPDQYRFGIQLVACCQALGRVREARGILEETFARKKRDAAEARDTLEALKEEMKGKKPEEITEAQGRKFRSLAAQASFNPYAVATLMGTILFEEGKDDEALGHLKEAEAMNPGDPGLHVKLGQVYLRMQRWDDAKQSFHAALRLDPDRAEAYLGLCRVCLATRRLGEACDAAYESLGRRYHNPTAHYLLGVARHRQGRLPEALLALKMAVHQNPDFAEAHERLAYIYKRRLGNKEKGSEHARSARDAARKIREFKKGQQALSDRAWEPPGLLGEADRERKQNVPGVLDAPPKDLSDTVVVVTGLPRAGTSMIMQMLHAGGLDIMADDLRKADEDNPKGYLEYAPVKRLHADVSWLSNARGKAIKIVAPLLKRLKQGLTYRVIFVERDIDEVIASQNTLLARQGKQGARLSDPDLARVLDRQATAAKRILAQKRIPVLFVGYHQCIRHPREAAERIRAFLGASLCAVAMAGVVDPALYRQRGEKMVGIEGA